MTTFGCILASPPDRPPPIYTSGFGAAAAFFDFHRFYRGHFYRDHFYRDLVLPRVRAS